MNIILAAADLLFDVDTYRRTVTALDAVTTERDAALQRVTAQDAWERARRERANR